MVQQSGGRSRRNSRSDVYRRYKRFKPQDCELNEGGQQLAYALAEEVAVVVDDLTEKTEGEMPELPKKKLALSPAPERRSPRGQ
jgi:hypothetical protein